MTKKGPSLPWKNYGKDKLRSVGSLVSEPRMALEYPGEIPGLSSA